MPVTVTGLMSHGGYTLTVDGKPVDQAVHGSDFWQSDYDSATGSWSRTWNLPLNGPAAHRVELFPSP